MENKDLENYLDECQKLLDDNLDVLSNIQYDLDQQKEDELVPDLQLTDLIEMTSDVADSSKIKKAEFKFVQRFIEKSSQITE